MRLLPLAFALVLLACTDGSDGSAPSRHPSTTLSRARFDPEAVDRCGEARDSGRYEGDLVAAFVSTVGDVAAAFAVKNDPGYAVNREESTKVCWFDDGTDGQVVVIFSGDNESALPADRLPTRP